MGNNTLQGLLVDEIDVNILERHGHGMLAKLWGKNKENLEIVLQKSRDIF